MDDLIYIALALGLFNFSVWAWKYIPALRSRKPDPGYDESIDKLFSTAAERYKENKRRQQMQRG